MNTKEKEKTYDIQTPNEKWQDTGREFVSSCENNLWGKVGTKARKYLSALGLKDTTLRNYRIGFNSYESFEDLNRWGLPFEQNKNGNPRKVWLPKGIIVPYFINKTLFNIKIRQYKTQEQKRRGERQDYFVKGGVLAIFGVENIARSKFTVLADNEFDAMLLDQEVGDTVDAASFGKPISNIGITDCKQWLSYLLPVGSILIPVTSDGEITFTESLLDKSERFHKIFLSDNNKVKAVTDLRIISLSPRKWLQKQLDKVGSIENAVSDSKEQTEEIEHCAISQEEFVIVSFEETAKYDPTRYPGKPCFSCQNEDYWQRPDGGWVCSTCHPNPNDH